MSDFDDPHVRWTDRGIRAAKAWKDFSFYAASYGMDVETSRLVFAFTWATEEVSS